MSAVAIKTDLWEDQALASSAADKQHLNSFYAICSRGCSDWDAPATEVGDKFIAHEGTQNESKRRWLGACGCLT